MSVSGQGIIHLQEGWRVLSSPPRNFMIRDCWWEKPVHDQQISPTSECLAWLGIQSN
jgi:hypothetical protein